MCEPIESIQPDLDPLSAALSRAEAAERERDEALTDYREAETSYVRTYSEAVALRARLAALEAAARAMLADAYYDYGNGRHCLHCDAIYGLQNHAVDCPVPSAVAALLPAAAPAAEPCPLCGDAMPCGCDGPRKPEPHVGDRVTLAEAKRLATEAVLRAERERYVARMKEAGLCHLCGCELHPGMSCDAAQEARDGYAPPAQGAEPPRIDREALGRVARDAFHGRQTDWDGASVISRTSWMRAAEAVAHAVLAALPAAAVVLAWLALARRVYRRRVLPRGVVGRLK